MAAVKHPVLLVVLDGWGHTENTHFNAIDAARTPVWDALMAGEPHTLIRCSGASVGLPGGQMGNSEVGHMHIGAGRLIDQDYTRIGKAVADDGLRSNVVLRDACNLAASSGNTVHVLGLLSPGGVHSHEDHIIALIDLAISNGASRVLVHAFLDGRDTPPQSAAASLDKLAAHCAGHEAADIASITGRYYAMDRNGSWDRTATAYRLIVDGEGEFTAETAIAGLEAAYARGETDEFVKTTSLPAGKSGVAEGDVMLFANFRADRARQLTAALTATDFNAFERKRHPRLAAFVTMTDYGAQFDLPIAFPAFDLPNTFGEAVAKRGLRQLRIAETEKYAHVTFFFNGGEECEFEGEDRVLVPSPDVATYDLKPEMSAVEVTDRLVDAIAAADYDAIVCNYANADMVGHTGNFEATVKCIETLDACLGRVVDAARKAGVEVLITADHGNAEKMRAHDADGGSPHTAHTSNLVPLVYIGRDAELATDGSLVDLAPTLLELMGLPIPGEMTGRPLVSFRHPARDAA